MKTKDLFAHLKQFEKKHKNSEGQALIYITDDLFYPIEEIRFDGDKLIIVGKNIKSAE